MSRSQFRPLLVLTAFCAIPAIWLAIEDGPARNSEHLPSTGSTADQESLPESPSVALPEPSVVHREPFDAAREHANENLLLRVVDGNSQMPLPGALVVVATELPGESRMDSLPRWVRQPWWVYVSNPADLMLGAGEEYLADEEGSVRVVKPEKTAWIWASKGALQGIAQLRAKEQTQTVELFANNLLRARVEDSSNRPQPMIPVRLTVDQRNMTRLRELFVGAAVAPDTVITVSNVRSRMNAHMYRPGATRYYLLPKVTLCNLPGVEVFRDALPMDLVRIEAPPTGSVRVQVQDPEGRPYEDDASVRVYWRAPEMELCDERPFENGEVVFPYVMVGAPLNAMVRFAEESGLDEMDIHHPGIVREDDHVDIIVRVPNAEETKRVLSGRLFGADGKILANQACIVQPLPSTGFQDLRRPDFVTSEDGTFRYVHPSYEYEMYKRRSIYRADASPSRRLEEKWRADFDVPPAGQVGLFDLGDLHMQAVPGLVSGRVTRGPYNPVAGAMIFGKIRDLGESARDSRAAAGADRGDAFFEYVTTTDRDGRFALFSDLKCTGGTISAALDGCIPIIDTPFSRGQSDLHLVMRAGCCVRGRLLLDDGVHPGLFSLRLHGSGHSESLSTRADGAFYMDGLYPGTYALEVRLAGGKEILHREDAIRLDEESGAGGDSIDIDLRGRVALCDIEVVTVDGDPIRGCRVVCKGADSAEGVTDRMGHARMVSMEPSLECVVRAEGYRDRIVVLPAGMTRVVLEDRAIPIRIKIAGDMDSLSSRFRPAAKLELVPPLDDPFRAFRHSLGYPLKEAEGRDLEWMVSEPGLYVLRVGVVTGKGAGLTTFCGADGLAFDLEVTDGTKPQEFQIDVTRTQLENALQMEFGGKQ